MPKAMFPILPAEIAAQKLDYPMYYEVLLDDDAHPVMQNGTFVTVSGARAVASWARMALETVRHRHVIYSVDYGCELATLIGRPYSTDLKTAEAPRMVREALMINPYITAVKNIQVEFDAGLLRISADMDTIYGEVSVNA